MRPTAYEHTQRSIRDGLVEAQRLDREQGVVKTLHQLIQNRFSGRPLPVLNDRVLAALPFVLGSRVSKSLPNPYDWEAFGTHDEITAFIDFEQQLGNAVYDPNLALDWASASILNLWHYSCHEAAGKRVFELSPGLTDRLQKTEVRGLSTDDLRLPYPSIYVVMPETLDLKLANQLTGQHDVGGVYVTETRLSGVRVWKLLFWGPPNASSRDEYDDALFHFTVRLPDGMDLEDALEATARESSSRMATEHTATYYNTFWRPLFKLVMNAVVYATWPDAELRTVENPRYVKLQEQLQKHPKGSAKRERAKDELREVAQQRRVLLGPSVKRLDAEPTSTELTVRTLVTGHWQRFAYGPGRAHRKWGWREPFWRGPADAPESNPRRVLSEES